MANSKTVKDQIINTIEESIDAGSKTVKDQIINTIETSIDAGTKTVKEQVVNKTVNEVANAVEPVVTTATKLATSLENSLTDTVTLAAVPVTMLNGTLKSADSGLSSLKAQLDADILAAQSKAKTNAALVLASVKTAIADVEAWIESIPGQTLVVLPSKQASNFLSEIESLKALFSNELKNVEAKVGKEVATLEAEATSFWSKIVNWFKGVK